MSKSFQLPAKSPKHGPKLAWPTDLTCPAMTPEAFIKQQELSLLWVILYIELTISFLIGGKHKWIFEISSCGVIWLQIIQ